MSDTMETTQPETTGTVRDAVIAQLKVTSAARANEAGYLLAIELENYMFSQQYNLDTEDWIAKGTIVEIQVYGEQFPIPVVLCVPVPQSLLDAAAFTTMDAIDTLTVLIQNGFIVPVGRLNPSVIVNRSELPYFEKAFRVLRRYALRANGQRLPNECSLEDRTIIINGLITIINNGYNVPDSLDYMELVTLLDAYPYAIACVEEDAHCQSTIYTIINGTDLTIPVYIEELALSSTRLTQDARKELLANLKSNLIRSTFKVDGPDFIGVWVPRERMFLSQFEK